MNVTTLVPSKSTENEFTPSPMFLIQNAMVTLSPIAAGMTWLMPRGVEPERFAAYRPPWGDCSVTF